MASDGLGPDALAVSTCLRAAGLPRCCCADSMSVQAQAACSQRRPTSTFLWAVLSSALYFTAGVCPNMPWSPVLIEVRSSLCGVSVPRLLLGAISYQQAQVQQCTGQVSVSSTGRFSSNMLEELLTFSNCPEPCRAVVCPYKAPAMSVDTSST